MKLRRAWIPSACALSLLVCLLAGGAALAAVTGSLQVDVRDESGEPLPGATVVIESPAQLGQRSGVTSSEGVYRFNAVVPGVYTITVRFPEYGTTVVRDNVVRLDALTTVPVALSRTINETVTVTAETPLVDVTSTTIGSNLDQEFVEELPTVRTYQTNLTLVPSVDQGVGGNPVVLGGLSTDNLYLIDGINTTDPVTQTFGANINFDIIDEQQVSVAGHAAEYGGVVGLVSNLVTKSGGNDWSGNINYFRQDADWGSDTKNSAGGNETTAWSAAYTLGGPIVRDKLWHFSSWERNETEQITINTQGVAQPARMFESDYYFGKLTWQATPDHKLNLQINGDPTDIPNDNANDSTLTSSDQFSNQEQGGDNLSLRYTGILGNNLVLEGQATRVRGELNVVPAVPGAGPNHSSIFGSVTTQYGRYNNEQFSERDRDEYKANLSWFKQTGWGEHNVKVGVQYTETDFSSLNIGSGGVTFTDIPGLAGGGGISDNFNDFGDFVPFTGFASFRWVGLADENGWDCRFDGVDCHAATGVPADPTLWELDIPDGAGGFVTVNATDLVFPSSLNATAAGENWLRLERNVDSLLELGSEPVGGDVLALFAQDEWRIGRWTAYAGVRVEEQSLRDNFGDTYFEFETNVAPRLGATYDLHGDGRSKVFVHAGRLFDPVADGVTDFGNPAGDPALDFQLWVEPLGDFFTYFRVGGVGTGAAVVAPNLETPYTDELLAGYARDFGNNLALEVTGVYRETRDLVEDLEPTLGALNGSPDLAGLGFSDTNGDGVVDTSDLPSGFVIYNPPGAERTYKGVVVELTKRFDKNWSGLFGYSGGEFEGNISEDAAFGIVGDDAYLDPRLSYNQGKLGDVFSGGGVGANDHVLKANASYRFPIGLSVGATLLARSGTHYSLRSITTPAGNVGDNRTPTIWDGDPSTLVDTLGVDRDAFATFLGLDPSDPTLDAEIVGLIPVDLRSGRGAYTNPWNWFFDLSARYQFGIAKKLRATAFLDVFNVFDLQDASRRDGDFATNAPVTTANIDDPSIYSFGQTVVRQAPRSIQAGVKLNF